MKNLLKKLEFVKKLRNINRKTSIIISIFILVVAVAFSAYFFRGLFVVAVVNGKPISRLSIIETLEKKSGKATLDSRITQMLIDSEAQKKGIKITEDQINSQISTIESQIKAQGGTLDEELKTQGLTRDDLRSQIVTEKNLEALLADKTQVTDADVQAYIKTNNLKVPVGQEATYVSQVKDYLVNQKMSSVAQDYINSLKTQAKITYFVNY